MQSDNICHPCKGRHLRTLAHEHFALRNIKTECRARRTLVGMIPDRVLATADSALRTIFTRHRAARPNPGAGLPSIDLTDAERRECAGLMRVNHVGEVCAQALYVAQAQATRDPALRAHFLRAAEEETDHLAWTEERLAELGARPSVLNPLWYAGAFGLGLLAGRLGDAVSLGFVVETERQVEAHLQSHLERMAPGDEASRAIVSQMKHDEAEHAEAAQDRGAAALPVWTKDMMRAAAKVMTRTAHHI